MRIKIPSSSALDIFVALLEGVDSSRPILKGQSKQLKTWASNRSLNITRKQKCIAHVLDTCKNILHNFKVPRECVCVGGTMYNVCVKNVQKVNKPAILLSSVLLIF